MSAVTLASLTERLELADELLARRAEMLDAQDLPGRYGRVVKAVDHLLQAIGCPAVLGGGWLASGAGLGLEGQLIGVALGITAFGVVNAIGVRPGVWRKR